MKSLLDEVVLVKVGDQTITAHIHRASPEAAMAILCHGGPNGNASGPADLFIKLAAELGKIGISSARFDFRGSGESGLPFSTCSLGTMVEDLRAINDQTSIPRRTIIIGESLGGTVALMANLKTAARVLLWPALDLSDTDFRGCITAENLQQLDRSETINLGFETVSSEFFRSIMTTKLYPTLWQHMQPTLLIHGEADTEVPVHQSIIAHKILGDAATLRLYANGQHGLKIEPERSQMIAQICRWLKRTLKD